MCSECVPVCASACLSINVCVCRFVPPPGPAVSLWGRTKPRASSTLSEMTASRPPLVDDRETLAFSVKRATGCLSEGLGLCSAPPTAQQAPLRYTLQCCNKQQSGRLAIHKRNHSRHLKYTANREKQDSTTTICHSL